MSDLSKYFADPNGPAYRTREHRSGPPLDYVAEKLHNALFELHAAVQASGRTRDASSPKGGGRASASALDDVERSTQHAFGYQVTAFLALHNMLGVAGAPDHLARLQAMSPDDFERWLAFVEREGSVLGV